MHPSSLRIAIVGAGPSALYAAEAILKAGLEAKIAIIERLPVPFGLLRYGVAPDHPNMRALADKLEDVIRDPDVAFFGGIDVGGGLSVADLRSCFDAVVFAYGASLHRSAGFENEGARICIPSSEFARWYCGHPDADSSIFDIVRRARDAVVVGAGNVALDASRILSRSAEELATSEMPDRVREALGHVRTRQVTLLARRGPHQARFTTKELRELGELTDCAVMTDAGDFEGIDAGSIEDRGAQRNFELLKSWGAQGEPPAHRRKKLVLRFGAQPVSLAEGADGHILRVKQTGPMGGDAMTEHLVDLVVTAVGYRGAALEGLPFATDRGVIPTGEAGRVTDEQGRAIPGCYATGWIRRGPSGVVGSNKACAGQVVAALIEDLGRAEGRTALPCWEEMLRKRGLRWFDASHWHRVDQLEREDGGARGAVRTIIDDRQILYQQAQVLNEA